MKDVVGVDAAGALGWVGVRLREGRLASIEVHATLVDLVRATADVAVVAIDIPLGHEDPEGGHDQGRRACDRAARQFLGPARQSTVFWVPPPAALAARDHSRAVALCRERGWSAPSAQLWALRGRILEADSVRADARFHEVHPEVSFQSMLSGGAEGGRLGHPKTTWAGLVDRLELLHRAKLRPERSLGGVGKAGPDDVLDATAAAWSAWRIHQGKARTLPAKAPVDPMSGRPVAIWY